MHFAAVQHARELVPQNRRKDVDTNRYVFGQREHAVLVLTGTHLHLWDATCVTELRQYPLTRVRDVSLLSDCISIACVAPTGELQYINFTAADVHDSYLLIQHWLDALQIIE